MIDAVFARAVYQSMEATCLSAERLLEELRMDPEVLHDRDARIPFQVHIEFMELAAKISGDDQFGLRLGRDAHPKDSGVLGYIALNSATVADAMRRVQRYWHVMAEGELIELEIDGDELIISYLVTDLEVMECRQNDDMTLASIVSAITKLTGKTPAVHRVEFVHSEPADTTLYRTVFGSPVIFGEARNAIVVSKDVLDFPVRAPDLQLLHILEQYCRQILEDRERINDLLNQVEQVIVKRLSDGNPKAAAVAQDLAMSDRTLSRRLHESGTSYREILDQVRSRLSIRYLQDSRFRVSEIAFMLGYSELSAFNRAFRRWSGLSPTGYRHEISA